MNPLLASLVLAAAPTPVVRAVVYPDRAQVTRRVQVACGPRARATFAALPPAADPGSLRAHTSAGTVLGLRAEAHDHPEAYAQDARDLDAKLRGLDLQLTGLRDAHLRAEAQARTAGAYAQVATGQIDREMLGPTPGVKAWNSAFELALATQLSAMQEEGKLDTQRRALTLQRATLQTRRDRLTTAAGTRTYDAEVLVSCAAGQSAAVELTYLVGGAGWSPAYEARADEAGGAVELATLATVHQATGEPWTHAKLVLSTAVPRQSATPPELEPLRIHAEAHDEEKKVLVRRDEEQKHAESSADFGGSTQANGAPGLSVANQGISVQLTVPQPADLAGDGTPARLFVARTRMPARFAYRTAPKLQPFVFRVADLSNTAPFPLLAGPLDAFRAGDFVGQLPLPRTAMGAVFHLTFGIDEAVKVKRTVVKEIQRETGLFGGNHRYVFSYRFELANYQAGTREVELAEAMPVSELDDVHVALDEATTAGYTAQKDDGILTWKLKLASGSKKTVDLAFHVDVPESYDRSGI